jgi:hypothetical protein
MPEIFERHALYILRNSTVSVRGLNQQLAAIAELVSVVAKQSAEKTARDE